MDSLTPEILAPYLKIESEHSIRPANEFTKEVLDHYLLGDEMVGYKLPWPMFDETFRLRGGECSILAGINSSGKSLALGQVALQCMVQAVSYTHLTLPTKRIV